MDQNKIIREKGRMKYNGVEWDKGCFQLKLSQLR